MGTGFRKRSCPYRDFSSSHISSRSRDAMRCKTRPPSAPLAEAADVFGRWALYRTSREVGAAEREHSLGGNAASTAQVLKRLAFPFFSGDKPFVHSARP